MERDRWEGKKRMPFAEWSPFHKFKLTSGKYFGNGLFHTVTIPLVPEPRAVYVHLAKKCSEHRTEEDDIENKKKWMIQRAFWGVLLLGHRYVMLGGRFGWWNCVVHGSDDI